MGGGLVGQLVASYVNIAAGVIFYGPPPPLDKVGNVRCPVQGHYGGDGGITNNVPAFEEAMRAAGKDFAAFVYEGAPHAFNNDQRPSFHGESAKVAWGRTLEFFQEHLKGAPVVPWSTLLAGLPGQDDVLRSCPAPLCMHRLLPATPRPARVHHDLESITYPVSRPIPCRAVRLPRGAALLVMCSLQLDESERGLSIRAGHASVLGARR